MVLGSSKQLLQLAGALCYETDKQEETAEFSKVVHKRHCVESMPVGLTRDREACIGRLFAVVVHTQRFTLTSSIG